MLDHLGTQVGIISTTRVPLSLTDYAPFGQVFAGGSTDPYKFTGKERDAESAQLLRGEVHEQQYGYVHVAGLL